MVRFSLAAACVCALVFIVTPAAAALDDSKPALCYLPKKAGLCKNIPIIRVYYDAELDECRSFKYRCMGNKNRFDTFEDCERVCRRHSRNPAVSSSSEEYNQPPLPLTYHKYK